MSVFYRKMGEKIKKTRKSLGLSQERVAKSLGINRVAISQIESGDRKITAEEVARLSKIFNVPSNILLGLDKDIEVILEKKNLSKQKAKQEIRISVPQKNLKKFKEILLYILKKVGSRPMVHYLAFHSLRQLGIQTAVIKSHFKFQYTLINKSIYDE